MDISVVIPLFNEEESLDELSSWIDRVMKAHSFSYELIMIDDGSNDGSWKKIEEISSKMPELNGIKFRRNYGKSAALNSGFEMAQGNVIITMDADLQDSPEEIPDLYKMIVEDDLDLVSGWKRKRKDPIMKTMPSKLFNWTTRKMTGIQLRDFNCGLKSYRKELVKNIEVYGEMHRYIPVIAKWAGFIKIGEKEVDHQERKYGVTKYGVERFVNGFLDLLSISFVSKFGKRPMHLFGFVGTIMFMLGFLMAVYLGVDKLYYDTKARLIADNPLFYIALVVMILGTQMFLSGFLAEMIARSSHDRNKYQVEKVLKGASSRINE
jgi:glycosyltransferase involved in cell wall biosynthesis